RRRSDADDDDLAVRGLRPRPTPRARVRGQSRNYLDSLNNRSALLRPIFVRSASLIEQSSNQIAAWSTFSNGQSVENMMGSAPTSRMQSISAGVRKLPEGVREKVS